MKTLRKFSWINGLCYTMLGGHREPIVLQYVSLCITVAL